MPFFVAIAGSILVFVVIGGGVKLISMATGVALFAPYVGAAAAGLFFLVSFFLVYVHCILVTPLAMMERPRIATAFGDPNCSCVGLSSLPSMRRR